MSERTLGVRLLDRSRRVEPFAYLRDVSNAYLHGHGHPMSRLDDLLSWKWIQLKAAA